MKTIIQNLNLPLFNIDHKARMNRLFTYEKVRTTAFQISPLKAFGNDGKPRMFYQKYLNIVGALTTASSLSCLNSSHLLRELNKTLITLIPKVDCPRSISQYRPISLCNVAYKIISREIANRLQPIMDNIISPY